MAAKKNFLPQIYAGSKEDKGYDLSKRWFVFLTKATPSGNKRFKYFGNINKFHTVDERLRECHILIKELNSQPLDDAAKYWQHALMKELQSRAAYQRKKGALTYATKVKYFLRWIDCLPANQISEQNARDFIKHLFERGLSATTVNNYRTLLKSLFAKINSKQNPFDKLPKYKESRQSLMYFDNSDIEKIRNRLSATDPQQWLVAQMLYYCFIRPGELRRLKWENVNFVTQQIYIPGVISKNGKSSFVIIPDPFLHYMKARNYHNEPKTNFIAGNQEGKKIWGRDTLSKQHRKHLVAMGYSNRYSLYSWKHTGVVKVALSGINMKELQMQLRHSSLDMVDEYLKNLGVYDCNQIRTLFPEI